MGMLVLGLVLFLGVHSTRIVAEGWRTGMVARLGEKPWKAAYSLVAIAGFVLMVWGYGLARQSPVLLWPQPPAGLRHLASLLTLAAFVLLVAAYVPRNHLRAKLHHPMVLAVKAWALAHLLANGTLADLVLGHDTDIARFEADLVTSKAAGATTTRESVFVRTDGRWAFDMPCTGVAAPAARPFPASSSRKGDRS